MAVSLRQRHPGREIKESDQVAAAPPAAAEPPAELKPVEQPKESDPVRAAEQNALRQRLQEMERADALKRQQQQPEPPEPQAPQAPPQQQPAMPPAVEKFLSANPQYLDPNDHVAQAEIHLATVKCMRDGKTWEDPDFIPNLERYLGISNGQVEQHKSDVPNENITPPPRPRPAPSPQRPASAVAYSAPPTRDVPSMSTGRVPQLRQTTLSADEKEIAWVSRSRESMTPREAYEEYARNKIDLQNKGLIGPGARDGR